MLLTFLLTYVLGQAYQVAGQGLVIQSNCPQSAHLLENNIYNGLDMVPGRVGFDLGEFDPNVFLYSLSTTGTHAGFNMATGEYFIVKNTSAFDVGVNIEVVRGGNDCPNVQCTSANCTTALTQTPTFPSNVTSTSPIFSCPGESVLFRVTFCPLGKPADPGAVALTLHPKGDPSKCMDVRGNVLANGTPVQVFDCNGTPAQKWSFLAEERGPVKVSGTNFCLDAGSNPTNGVQMKIWECFDGLLQQTWEYGSLLQTLTLDTAVPINGELAFLCLDDTNGNLTNTQTLQTWQCFNGNSNQNFTTGV